METSPTLTRKTGKALQVRPLPSLPNYKAKVIYINCLIDNYSKEALKNIVEKSSSMAELSKKLGYKTSHGKNYETIQKRLNDFDISIKHFKQSHAQRELTAEEVFCQNSIASRKTVRRFYLTLNTVEYKCVECGVTDKWNNKPLTLQLDHIDGDGTNNSLDNLRWLCPNCHSQTQTFAGKNVSKERKHYYCIDCGEEISGAQSNRCVKCNSIKNRKVERPTKDDLLNLLKWHDGNFTFIANVYQVSDNTIRKWCKQYGLPIHTSDYAKPKPQKKKNSETQRPKPCYMLDKKTGEILMEFSSRKAAGKYVKPEDKGADVHIGAVCMGKRKTAYGYKWKDKNDLN